MTRKIIVPTRVSPLPKKENIEIDFPNAIREVLLGKKITKLEWNDPEFYILLQDGYLRIHKPDNKFYDLIVSDGDMNGTDWVVIL
jgi:hypothetical protein